MSIRLFGYFLCFAIILDLSQAQESAVPTTVVGTCGGTIKDTQSGYIASPGYPTKNYPDNSNCSYVITADPGNVISYQSVLTDLEVKDPKTDKCHDFIQLYDGDNLLGQSIRPTGKFCGNQNIPLNATRGNTLRIQFTSDQLTNDKGFVLQWSILNPAEMESSFNCNFDGAMPLCPGWTQSTDEYADWLFERGSTGTKSTGPSADHTEDTTDGRYAYIEASEMDENEWADLLTPSVGPDSGASYCLNFWYHMHGIKIGTLQVIQVFEGEDEGIELFSVGENLGDVWTSAEVNLKGGEKAFYLMFRATVGDSFYSDIAIDDVTITPEQCPSYEETTAIPEPATGTATGGYYFTTDSLFTNCTGDKFLCDDELDCISNSYVCDGELDCPDGSDENNCPEPSKCKENLIWKTCGSACDRTCADGEDGIACTLQCVQKCGCPTSEPVLHNGRCIRYEECPASLKPLEEVATASVSDVSLDSAILTFETVASAKSFLVKLYDISSPEPVQEKPMENDSPTLRITFSDLTAGTEYRITIESVNPGKENVLSSVELKFTTNDVSEVTTFPEITEAYTGEYYGTTGFEIANTESPVDDVTVTPNTEETTPNPGTFSPIETTEFPDYETTIDDLAEEKDETTQNPVTFKPTDAEITVANVTDDVKTTSSFEDYDETTVWDYGTTDSQEIAARKDETTPPEETANSVTEAGAATTDLEFEITTEANVAVKITPPVTENDEITQKNVIEVTEAPEIDETTEYFLEGTTANDFDVSTESDKKQTTEAIEETTSIENIETAKISTEKTTTTTTTTLAAQETTEIYDETTFEELEETTYLEDEIIEKPTTTTTTTLAAVETSQQYDETTLEDSEETTKLSPKTTEKIAIAATVASEETTGLYDETTVGEIEETTSVEPETAKKTTTLAARDVTVEETTLEKVEETTSADSDETTVKEIEEAASKEPERTQTTSATPITLLKATQPVIVDVTESPEEETTQEDLEITTQVAMTTTESLLEEKIETTEQLNTETIASTTSSSTESPVTEREETQSLFEDLEPGENITLSSDLTVSGMYKKNYTKLFNFVAAENYIVRVTFTKLSVHCDDGLHVYDDFFIGDEIARICGLYDVIEDGRKLPVVLSTINMMTMLFQTDGVNESSGFEIMVDSIPESSIPKTACVTKLIESVGEIASPNFPSQSEMTNCEYEFDLTEKQYLEMQFKLFSLGEDTVDLSCEKNSLSIISSDETLHKYCGILLPPPLTLAKSGKISVTSDSLQPGFWISYEIKECELDGQIYSESAPSCDNTCVNNANTECINRTITSKCHCPEDKPILFLDRCITVSECENPSSTLNLVTAATEFMFTSKAEYETTDEDTVTQTTTNRQEETTDEKVVTDIVNVKQTFTFKDEKLVDETEAVGSTESTETTTESPDETTKESLDTTAESPAVEKATVADETTQETLKTTESFEATAESPVIDKASTVVDETTEEAFGTTDVLASTESLETTSKSPSIGKAITVADETTDEASGTTDVLASTESLETTSKSPAIGKAITVADETTEEAFGTTDDLASTESLETTSKSPAIGKAITVADETTDEAFGTTDVLASTGSLETTSKSPAIGKAITVADGTTEEAFGTTDVLASTESLETTSKSPAIGKAITVANETTDEAFGTTDVLASTESLETTSKSPAIGKAITVADETTEEAFGTTDVLASTESLETTSKSLVIGKVITVADETTEEAFGTTDVLASTESLETTSKSPAIGKAITVTDETTEEAFGTTDVLASTESLETTSESPAIEKTAETTQKFVGTTESDFATTDLITDVLGSTESFETTSESTTSETTTSSADETTQESLETTESDVTTPEFTTDVLGSTESLEATSETITSATTTSLADETTKESLETTESDVTTPEFTTDVLGSTESLETTSESTTSATTTTLADETTQESLETTESDVTTPEFTTDVLESTESLETTSESTTSATTTIQAAETTIDTQETTEAAETTESELTTLKAITEVDDVKTTEEVGEFTTEGYTTEPLTTVRYTTESKVTSLKTTTEVDDVKTTEEDGEFTTEGYTTEQYTTVRYSTESDIEVPDSTTNQVTTSKTETTEAPHSGIGVPQIKAEVVTVMSDMACLKMSNVTKNTTYKILLERLDPGGSVLLNTYNMVSKNGHISKCVYNLTEDTSYYFIVQIPHQDDNILTNDFTTKVKPNATAEVIYEQTEETKEWKRGYIGWRNSFTTYMDTISSFYSDTVETKFADDLKCPEQLHRPPCKEELTPFIDSNGCLLLICKSPSYDAELTQDDVEAWEEEYIIYNDYLMPQWERSFQNYVAQLQDDEKDV